MSQHPFAGFADPALCRRLLTRLEQALSDIPGRRMRFMEVCGTHTVSIFRSGLRSLLPAGVEHLSGPGCPVCVTHDAEVAAFLDMAGRDGVILATFGDLLRVPGPGGHTLKHAQAQGARIEIVYSPLDALTLAAANPSATVVFLAIGFETTAPTVAATLMLADQRKLNNFCIFSLHKLVPPALRALLEESNDGYVYSFWPDVLTLKEIGDPADIATYFRLWNDDGRLEARNIVVQCRQNTNYDIVRYAAHPFFLQGYTLCANGENTFHTKNTELQRSLHRGYIGFESDSQNFLYTLHYVLHELRWPIQYYKHVITPLPFAEMARRPDHKVLTLIRESLAHLEINGPNAIIGLLPDGNMLACCDSKKLRPMVIGGDENTVAISSEVCGLNAILPDRDTSRDIYPGERETIVIDNNLEVQRWKQ